MSEVLNVKVEIDDEAIERKLGVLLDDKTNLEIQNTLARFCNDYVPFLEGPLSQTIEVTPDGVTYTQPYSHYQYYLHDMNEDLAGTTNRTRVYHPKATSFWDKAMMMEKGEVFMEEVKRILIRRANELYGSSR